MKTRNLLISVFSLLLPSISLQAQGREADKALPTPLVTGNGFGFAVTSPDDGLLKKFYMHPYKFEKADLKNPLSEGVETTNLIESLQWYHKGENPEVDYYEHTHIIRVKNAEQQQAFFMPFELPFNALIVANRISDKSKSQLNIKWAHKLVSHQLRTISGKRIFVLKFQGLNEQLLVVPLKMDETQNLQNSDYFGGDNFSRFQTHQAWALLPANSEKDYSSLITKLQKWDQSRSFDELISEEQIKFESWRVKSPVHLSEREYKLWRQSETVLRMAQSREPNNAGRNGNGLILASLPDGAWFVPWVRDMVYATLALSRMGHQREAENAIDSFFNARPVSKMQKELANLPYQVSVVRYFGNGEEEPFFTMEGANNIELDDWGLVLWLLGEHAKSYPQSKFLDHKTYRGSVYESAKNFVVKPLLANLESYHEGLIVKADTSIWEEKQKNKKHFAFSTIMAIKGLEAFEKLAQAKNDLAIASELRTKIALLKKGFLAAFVKNNALRGALEAGVKNEVDGATLSAITLGIVSDEQIIKGTLKRMEALKEPSGGYRRVTSVEDDPKVFEYWYERQEFLFIDFLMAEVLYKQGDRASAEKIVRSIAEQSEKDHFFVPEMYVSRVNDRFKGPVGTATGAVPMVGYGAGVFELFCLLKQGINGVGKAEFF